MLHCVTCHAAPCHRSCCFVSPVMLPRVTCHAACVPSHAASCQLSCCSYVTPLRFGVKEQVVITTELDASAGSNYWIGLSRNDTGNSGTYLWSSGDPVLYTAWTSRHTGNEAGTCVGMQTQRPVGMWQSINCSLQLPYVCRYLKAGYTLPPTTTTVATTTPIPCPNGWTGFEHTCYKAFTGTPQNWRQAMLYCHGFGADLPSIHNDTVHPFLKTLLGFQPYGRQNFWIGLTDSDKEGTYLWSDRTPTDYTKWGTSEPNDQGGSEDCVEFNTPTNAWNDNSCYILNSFICALPRGSPLLTTLSPPTTTAFSMCAGTQWLSHNDSCYYISPLFGTAAKMSWFAARRYCLSQGADLASITSQDENTFLNEYLTRQQNTLRNYWIGFNQLGSQTYQWTDGSAAAYENWNENEPNDAYGGQMCVNLYSQAGKWNDDNCMDSNNFICKRSVSGSAKPPVPTPSVPGGCPPDFKGIGNVCYKAVIPGIGKGLNYTGARDACRAISARHPVDIASITSHGQQAFLMTLLEGQNQSVYIGLNDQYVEGYFVWQDNLEVTVTYWAPNQPSRSWSYPQEDCVVVKLDSDSSWGSWDDVNCVNGFGYVCMTLKDPTYPIVTPSLGGCGKSGYLSHGDSCYAAYTTPQSWSDAERTCQQDGGHLVSLRDVHEASVVDVLIYNTPATGSFWIGMSFQTGIHKFVWMDGWPVSLTQWSQGDPDLQGSQACVMVQDGKWNDTQCTDNHSFVCKISTVTPPPTTAPPPGFCVDPSATPNGAFCYFAAPQETVSWPDARYQCNKRGMQLLSLHSADELAFVQKLVNMDMTTTRFSTYLGDKRVWLGLERNAQGGFDWSDASAFDYHYWNDGEPNNMNNQEDCAELLIDSGKWNDMPCIGQTHRGYVCKTAKFIPTTTPLPTTTPSPTTMRIPTRRPTGQHPVTPLPSTSTPRPHVMTTQRGPVTSRTAPGGPTRRPTGGPKTNQGASAAPSTGNNANNTLGGGEIAGIVIGILAAVAVVFVVIFFVRLGKLQLPFFKVQEPTGFINASYSTEMKEEVALSSKGAVSNGGY